MYHLFPQDNTEIFGYLLGAIAAFGSWASRIPPLSRIVRLGRGWGCGSPWQVLGHLGVSSELPSPGVEGLCRVCACVHVQGMGRPPRGGPEVCESLSQGSALSSLQSKGKAGCQEEGIGVR